MSQIESASSHISEAAPRVEVPAIFNAATYFVDANLQRGLGNKVAIYCEGREVTYAQVAEQVNRAGNALRALGLQMEQRVLLLLLDSPEYAAAFFGAMKIGAVPIPTNTLLKPADYKYLLNDSRAVFAIVSEPLLPVLEAVRDECRYLREIVVVSNQPGGASEADLKTKGYKLFHELLEEASPILEAEPTSRDDAAFWLYSSGTTGFPKGAVHLHRDMVYCTEYYARGILNMTENDRCYSVAKLFFAYGLGNGLYFPFGVGGSTVLLPGRPEPRKIFELVATYKPTLFYGVPTAYAQLLATAGDFDMSSVRAGVSAGEALPKSVWERFKERFGVEILDGIGSTEVLHIFISNRLGDVRPGSSGKVVPGYEARIEDEQGREVGPNEEGHLLIKGSSTCVYYWNKWDKSRETIIGEWIRTGDKYHKDEDGYYWYHGRADDMIKAGGIWVSPVEVENALAAHPAVLETGVIGRMDADELYKPCAFVVLKSDYQAGPELEAELKQFVKDKIAVYKYPRWIIIVDSLPRTATGKLQRFKLRQMQS
ncbi:MAG TPA: benzoate-CoA ligase family protein [Chloroflexia bacterium]|nr:benzoate-CoA ligase family protein [Chloroflexia bacterium]